MSHPTTATTSQLDAYADMTDAELRELREELEIDQLCHEPGATAELLVLAEVFALRDLCPVCTAPLAENCAWNCGRDNA